MSDPERKSNAKLPGETTKDWAKRILEETSDSGANNAGWRNFGGCQSASTLTHVEYFRMPEGSWIDSKDPEDGDKK